MQATQMKRFPSGDHGISSMQGKPQAQMLNSADDSQQRRHLKVKIGEDYQITETPATMKRLEEMDQQYQRIENLLLQISQSVGEMKS